MKFSRLERLYQTPKKWKLAFQKVQAFKFILQNAALKLPFFQTSIFKFYLLSPMSASLLPTCSTSSFQKLVEKSKIICKKFDSFWNKQFGALILSIFLFWKKMFFLVKWAKANAFSSIGKMKLIKMLNIFQPIKLRKREFDRLEKIWQIYQPSSCLSKKKRLF